MAGFEFTSTLQKWVWFVTWKVRQAEYGRLGNQLKELKCTRAEEGLLDPKNEKSNKKPAAKRASGKAQPKRQQ